MHIQNITYFFYYPVYYTFYKCRILFRAFAGKTETVSYFPRKIVKVFVGRIIYCGILCFVGFSPFLRLKDAGRTDDEKKSQIKAKDI